ncbi:MAG: SOS response-associated peptidase [Myxococcota bacterium]
MCGRYTLHTEKELLARRFAVPLEQLEGLEPRYNIAPSQAVLVIRGEEQGRRAEPMRWGLVPRWAHDLSMLPTLINARAETLARKPAFRDAFRRRRCLIPADGFYEWRAPEGLGRHKIPFWISLRGGEPFAMAGLWEEWRPPDEGPESPTLRSCTIVTTEASSTLRQIHPRMPVVLRPESEASWLDPELDDPEPLTGLLQPLEDERLEARPISRRVNATRNDGPELIDRHEDATLGF